MFFYGDLNLIKGFVVLVLNILKAILLPCLEARDISLLR